MNYILRKTRREPLKTAQNTEVSSRQIRKGKVTLKNPTECVDNKDARGHRDKRKLSEQYL